MKRVEFFFKGRHFAVVYSDCGTRRLEEFISPKRCSPYWRHVPPYGRTQGFCRELLGHRSKKDFIRMSLQSGLAEFNK